MNELLPCAPRRLPVVAWPSRLWISLTTRPWRALTLIFLLTLCLTLGHLRMSPIKMTTGETDTWWPVVDSIEDGHGYAACFPGYFPFCGPSNRATAAREPAPVLLFAGVAALTRDSFGTAALVQIALNLAIVAGVYMLTRELRDTRTALLAALFWALYFPALRTEIGEVTGDLLAASCVTWGVFLFLRAQRTGRVACWLGAGLCIGVAALSRSATAIVALVLALGMLMAGLSKARAMLPSVLASLSLARALGLRVITIPLVRTPFATLRRLGQPLVLFVVAFGLVLSPWLVRNYLVFGRPVLGSTLTGYNLFRENSQLPSGDYLHFVAGSEADAAVASLLTRRTDLTGHETEAQMDAIYRSEALRIIVAHPLRYALASLARLPMLWFDWTVPQAYGSSYGVGGYLVWCQQLLLLLAALWGTWRLRRRAWPLVGGVVGLTLLSMLVIARLYLLIPVMPLVIVLAAVGCTGTARKVRQTIDASRRFHYT